MSRQRAVVVGGAGFLGSHLCERLLLDGLEVVCLDNYLTSTPANISHLGELGPFTELRHDATDHIDIPGNIDVVLHFASPASPVDYLNLPIQTLRVGAIGTQHTLDLAREKGARYILASTSEVYGDPEVHPQHEGYWGNVNPIGPRSVYDEAKRYAEALAMAYRRTHEVNTGIVRIFNTYGPRMRCNDGRAIPTFIWQALRGRPLTVAGDGSQTRSACYVDDLVEAVVRMVDSDAAGPVNLGNPDERSILDLAERIRGLVGSTSSIEFVPRPVDDPAIRRPDISLAGQLLGWAPTISLDDGLKRTIEWFRRLDEAAYGDSDGGFRASRAGQWGNDL
ncbi:SDR family oxidoreductase [Kibdelosporangium philippinense]|uniref:SDR family oxidoreductase n=1 Tax=Kibdelosporangium philippinense TaxID=211113 RepID=A0ABS8ZXB7_9PSEU|nr:UDP-glucuronic acid decarboxylase family protein [Kibdelosporangium philippinense]MCE7011785.1 SDR family oxidoreductase [Kibdelosporangium philippinense]